MAKLVFLIHFAATWYMVGLCWLVQRVQYPLMDRVGVEGYPAYEQAHVTRIGPVVAPVMLLELGTALLLLFGVDDVFRRPAFLLSLGLLALIWASTFGVQVPLHNTLVDGFDADAHASLVRTNWVRTIGWTARGFIIAWIAHQMSARSLG